MSVIEYNRYQADIRKAEREEEAEAAERKADKIERTKNAAITAYLAKIGKSTSETIEWNLSTAIVTSTGEPVYYEDFEKYVRRADYSLAHLDDYPSHKEYYTAYSAAREKMDELNIPFTI
tara:strand:+ start:167 stop:526 length:360 start_codon:yes stop_codon:yes gene_type:complete